MKVLIVHNRYRTDAPSGEDAAVRNERQMLERAGVEVFTLDRCNDDLQPHSLSSRAAVAAGTIWSQRSRAEARRLVRGIRPDVVHVHNTFAMLSPSVYGAIHAEGIPVVQTLHNFRFFCPGALFLRDGKPCEACVEKSLLESVRHRCYRGSTGATATLAIMLGLHRAIGTYSRDIDRYITPSRFGRSRALRAGLAADKVVVKPNFVPEPPRPGNGGGGYVLYVGRLLEGKGADTLVAAWRNMHDVRLKIIGDGAMRGGLEAQVRQGGLNVEFCGARGRAEVLQAIAAADLLVVPSVCYETFGLVVAEAFACGTPVLASRIGSLDELVEEGVTGRKFTAGDPAELAATVRRMLEDSTGLAAMRSRARAYFDAHLTEEQNLAQLMVIYEEVIARAAGGARAAVV